MESFFADLNSADRAYKRSEGSAAAGTTPFLLSSFAPNAFALASSSESEGAAANNNNNSNSNNKNQQNRLFDYFGPATLVPPAGAFPALSLGGFHEKISAAIDASFANVCLEAATPDAVAAQIFRPRKIQPRDAHLFALTPSRPHVRIDMDAYFLAHIKQAQQQEEEGKEGGFSAWRESFVDAAATSETSASLTRAPASRGDYSRGSTSNVPFVPGGADIPSASTSSSAAAAAAGGEEAVSWPGGAKTLTTFPWDEQGPPLLSMVPVLNEEPFKAQQVEQQEQQLRQMMETAIAEDATSTFEASSGVGVDTASSDLLKAYVFYSSDPRDEERYQQEIVQQRQEQHSKKLVTFGSSLFKNLLTPEEIKAGSDDDADDDDDDTNDGEDDGSDTDDNKDDDVAKNQENEEKKDVVKKDDGKKEDEEDEDAALDRILDTDTKEWLSLFLKHKKQLARAAAGATGASREEWAAVDQVNVDNFDALVPDMAMKYPFDLDIFQKQAIYRLERGESVFVAAHTSAGKTVVAEYAIALSRKHMTRAIYTSPIKALSNQKFRDFRETFGSDDVGLITGDVSINPEASCLIMTTEILRSMLYRGADIVRDIEWVIFDEVHYINDSERGVVWEEVIIMLPPHASLIALSATVPNALEFAEWIGKTKQRKMYVTGTLKRPVPLEHYLYTARDLHKVVDKDGKFLNLGYRAATTALKDATEKKSASNKEKFGAKNPAGGGAGGNFKNEQTEWNKLIEFLRKRDMLPVVVFAFSKRKCEDCANGLTTTDIATSSEKSAIHLFIEDSVSRLKGSDRSLPQVTHMRGLLMRGIGVHHGGLLPLIKEMVEILFSRGLIKVLFATETFAMGVNMPARTVVFNTTRKHDGTQFRDLLSGEYIQMSGRAGRRGLDPVGTVIIVAWNDVPMAATLQAMILGRANKLVSQFRLTYNMILNLLRARSFKVEEMMRRSFSEFSSQRLQPAQEQLIARTRQRIERLPEIVCILGDPDIANYHTLHHRMSENEKLIVAAVAASRQAASVFCPGRVAVVRLPYIGDCLAAVISNNNHFAGDAASTSGNNNNNNSSAADGKSATTDPVMKKELLMLVITGSLDKPLYMSQPAALAAPTAALTSSSAEIPASLASSGGVATQAVPAGKPKRGSINVVLPKCEHGHLVSVRLDKVKRVCREKIVVNDGMAAAAAHLRKYAATNYTNLPAGAAAADSASAAAGAGTGAGAATSARAGPADIPEGVIVMKKKNQVDEPVVFGKKGGKNSGGGAASGGGGGKGGGKGGNNNSSNGSNAVPAQQASPEQVFKQTEQQLLRLLEQHPVLGPPELTAADVKINEMGFVTMTNKKKGHMDAMAASKCHTCPKLGEHFHTESERFVLREKVDTLTYALSSDNMLLMPEFHQRLDVLRRLKYIDEDSNVLLKGRVAREINTVTESLIATELIFENILSPLSPVEIASLLSALLFEEKSSSNTDFQQQDNSATSGQLQSPLPDALANARNQLLLLTASLANMQLDCRVPIMTRDYVKECVNVGLMEVVYEWGRQMPFKDICMLTTVAEGTIVRCITRLHETCREFRNAARVIGDTALYAKMEAAAELIKRDIVFASSLYM